MADASIHEAVEAKHTGGDELLQLVSFNIGDEEFGVDILQVQEINRMLEVTRVPNAPEYVDGVINLRGKVIPIIDLRRVRHGQKRQAYPHCGGGDERVVGFVVTPSGKREFSRRD
jgi:chemotaxis signal transduction protein